MYFLGKMAVFWVVVPCSLVEVYQRFKVLAASIIKGDDDRGKDL
jgi:hypothetical protein